MDERALMYCVKCGAQIDDDSKFCPACGADLSSVQGGQPASQDPDQVAGHAGQPASQDPGQPVDQGASQSSGQNSAQPAEKKPVAMMALAGTLVAALVAAVVVFYVLPATRTSAPDAATPASTSTSQATQATSAEASAAAGAQSPSGSSSTSAGATSAAQQAGSEEPAAEAAATVIDTPAYTITIPAEWAGNFDYRISSEGFNVSHGYGIGWGVSVVLGGTFGGQDGQRFDVACFTDNWGLQGDVVSENLGGIPSNPGWHAVLYSPRTGPTSTDPSNYTSWVALK